MDLRRREAQSAPKMLPERWDEQWSSAPSNRLVLTRDPGMSWLSAEALDEASRVVVANLARLGIARGDRVIWSASPSRPSLIAAIGVLRAGATLVPVSTGQSDRERQTILAEIEPALVIDERQDESARSCRPTALSSGAPHDGASAEVRADDVALVIFTSGTTGNPKGAMITHGNLAAQVDALQEAWEWSVDDRLLSALPLFHVHGLVVALLASLSVGSGLILEPSFDAHAFAARGGEAEATMTFCVPTMLHRLHAASLEGMLASLRVVVSGSAPLSVELFDSYARAGVSVLERYGMTESLLTISNPLRGERRAGTVGLALPGVSLDLPPTLGEPAELKVSGPGIFAGYWRRPEATNEVLTDGWLSTGDMVSVDGDGYVSICGRQKDLIITGGHNVYPAEVEDVLVGSPAIAEAAVVGMASAEWGESVVAFIVPSAGRTGLVEAAEAQAANLSPFKRPRRYVILDSLPRNAMGKLQRHLLIT